MDGLRWLLLSFGVILIAGVYFYSRRTAPTKVNPVTRDMRLEPSLGEEDGDSSEDPDNTDEDIDDDISDDEMSYDEDFEDKAHSSIQHEQKIITLRLVAGKQRFYPGGELALSLRGLGLRHGKFGIFHRYEGIDENSVIFSVASLVEPGSFDLKNIKDQEIPGISLFLVLPGPIDGPQAFDLMVSAARALVQGLGGELLDESGSTLSIQRERYMREEIIGLQHGITAS
jgi:cell division protein ZipA